MKIKWALLATLSLVVGTSDVSFAQYNPFPGGTGRNQVPQYSPQPYSPPSRTSPTDSFATLPPNSYGQTSPANTYGRTPAASSYGQTAAPATYGTRPATTYQTSTPTFGANSPANLNGRTAPTSLYGARSQANSYQTTAPTNAYGTNSPMNAYGTSAPTNAYGTNSPFTSAVSNLLNGDGAAPQQSAGVAPYQQTQQYSPSQVSPGFSYGSPAQGHVGGPDHCATCYATHSRGSWYGGVSGVFMSRDQGDNVWLSYDQADIRDRVLNSNDADPGVAGGFGFNVGRYFNCGRNSLQVSYWGVFSDVAEANALGANTVVGLDTILHFDGLVYDPGTGAQPVGGTFFFNAERHRVQRDYEIHNIELNFLGHNYNVGCSPLTLGWTAGVRFLRFDEGFLYSTDPVDDVFTGAPEELHYGIDTENNLIGFQIGGRGDYCFGNRLSLFAETKAGLYGNHISHNSRIVGAGGFGFVNDPASPYNLQDVNIDSTKDDVAVIGQLGVGANFCLNRCWTLGVGYQAIGVSGVALAPHQIPRDFIGALDSVRTVDSSGSLILHGGFLRLEYCR